MEQEIVKIEDFVEKLKTVGMNVERRISTQTTHSQ